MSQTSKLTDALGLSLVFIIALAILAISLGGLNYLIGGYGFGMIKYSDIISYTLIVLHTGLGAVYIGGIIQIIRK